MRIYNPGFGHAGELTALFPDFQAGFKIRKKRKKDMEQIREGRKGRRGTLKRIPAK